MSQHMSDNDTMPSAGSPQEVQDKFQREWSIAFHSVQRVFI